VRLKAGVTNCPGRFQPLGQLLARSHWLGHVKRHRRNLGILGEADDLEEFLFSTSRQSLVMSFGKQLAHRQRAPTRKQLKNRSKCRESLVLRGGRWTAHDLRRSAATMMAQLGISGDVIDECLNHMIESRVRRTYIRDRREAQQVEAFDKLGLCLEQLTRHES
jgi:integrase